MEMRVLGPTEIIGDDGPVRLEAPKQRRLLAALVVAGGETRSADALIDALWGESPPPSAPKLLQVYVSQLRKALPAPARIETSSVGYQLALGRVSLDADRFESLVDEGRSALVGGNPALAASLLERALGLWRGEAYADFSYDEFARPEADRLAELRNVAREERVEALLVLGRHDAVLAELLALAAAEPLRERLHGQAMVALYRCGRQADALELFARLRARLQGELGLEPSPVLYEVQRRILQHDPSLLISPQRGDETPTLPASPNGLVGRERELGELRTLLLRDDVRLIVLSGVGGSGKTRLALEAARRNASSFANGAALVDLAPLRDPDLVVTEIARTLRVQTPGEDARETLVRVLRSRELLLVIDNAEHLRAAMPVLVELIREAPRLTLLVTSRVVLHLSGEHVYPVEPLDDEAATVLFAERAGDADARFTLDSQDDNVVRRICRRLDGLPLAIELAASHVRLVNPSELLARLDSRLPLLAGGPRDLPARQRTLRATLDWTVELLDEQGIHDLMRLAVFSGSCTLDAAETAYGISAERVSSLIDHNLVRRVPTASGSRYTMLETIREYALERLEATEGTEDARRVHAHYYLGRTGQGADTSGRQRAAFLDSMATDLDNLRATLRWSIDREPATALKLAAAVSGFWMYHDHLTEGRRWLEEVLAHPHEPSRELAIVTAELARILLALGDYEAAGDWIDSAFAIAEELALPDVICDLLNSRGAVLDASGRYEEALALLERALALDHEHNLGKSHLRTLYNLAHMMDEQDDHYRARSYDLQGLELMRDAGLSAQRYLGNLIWRHVILGEWDEALALSEQLEETTIPGRLGDVYGPSWIRVQRGEVSAARHALDRHRHLAHTGDFGSRVCFSIAEAVVLRAEGRNRDALTAATTALRASASPRHDGFKLAFIEAVESAFALDDHVRARELLEQWNRLESHDKAMFLTANERRFTARLAARAGENTSVEPALRRAADLFRQMSMPFYLAVALLELGEWLPCQGRRDDAETLVAEARQIFEGLRAIPWLERASTPPVGQALVSPI